MLRFQSFNPANFVDILVHGGCKKGPRSGALQSVENPKEPGLYAVVRMTYPLHPEVWRVHLENLRISEEEFYGWFQSYRPSNPN